VTRSQLISLAAAGLAAAGAAPAASDGQVIPTRLVGLRFLVLGRAPDGATLRFWLDNDGSGFVFADVVKRYGLDPKAPDFFARLIPGGEVPPQARPLPVIARTRTEPLFADIDGQLGASWFTGRLVSLDYPAARLTILAPGSPFPADEPQRGQFGDILGIRLRVALDVAASVALKPGNVRAGGLGPLRATTFIRHELMRQLAAQQPDWTYKQNVGVVPGIDSLLVGGITFAGRAFQDVLCTTRPHDDVFARQTIDLKLGANAFGDRVLLLDGQRDTFGFLPSSA
jgi:hypothetical protein